MFIKYLNKLFINYFIKGFIMEIPNHLQHTPILKVENYRKIDGPYANNTDAEGLSLGVANWGDLSVKVWRYTGEKWSRQSEELSLHRAIDLTTLICSAISYCKNDIILSDDKMNITARNDERILAELKKLMTDEYIQNTLDEPLKRLSKMLKQIGY